MSDRKVVELVFDNEDAIPRETTVTVGVHNVPHVLAWYGAYFAGDTYTARLDGAMLVLDQNGELVK